MDVQPFISQHETNMITDNTRKNQDEDNQGKIGKDIHSSIIHDNIVLTEVEAQQELTKTGHGNKRPIQYWRLCKWVNSNDD